jgi:hypothetical protein
MYTCFRCHKQFKRKPKQASNIVETFYDESYDEEADEYYEEEFTEHICIVGFCRKCSLKIKRAYCMHYWWNSLDITEYFPRLLIQPNWRNLYTGDFYDYDITDLRETYEIRIGGAVDPTTWRIEQPVIVDWVDSNDSVIEDCTIEINSAPPSWNEIFSVRNDINDFTFDDILDRLRRRVIGENDNE